MLKTLLSFRFSGGEEDLRPNPKMEQRLAMQSDVPDLGIRDGKDRSNFFSIKARAPSGCPRLCSISSEAETAIRESSLSYSST
jgi:hypothetical protein